MLARPETRAAAGVGDFPDETWKKNMPTIVEYLTQDKWPDNKDRELATVSIKFQDGRVLAVLNDQDLRRSLYVSGDDVSKALRALEKALNDPVADWRAWGGNKKKK